jgi:serine/threonine protein kinase
VLFLFQHLKGITVPVKCPECQHENPEETSFCGKCGTQLPSIENIEVTETMETPKQELTTGSTFAERYQIIEELGKGGMGRVYRALDKELNEEIALKLIKPEIARHQKSIDRFKIEIKLARKVIHKNIGRVHELMEEKGIRFITMEYVPGEDLKSFIRRSGQMAVGTTLRVARQVCEGLAEAHEMGIVHRDLKPNNIIIDKEGNARIMDFGIARSLMTKGITEKGVMISTPEYMSPEQVEGKEVDQRSDIYSLGIILYEMLAGRVPFEGDTPFTIGVKHKSESPRPPKEWNEQIPDDLSQVILKCLEKDKENRYQSVGEVRSDLESIEKGMPTTEKVVPRRKTSTSREVTVTFSLKKLWIPALLAAVLIAAGVFLWRVVPKRETLPAVKGDKPSIAVLYFENNSGKEALDHWRSGLSEMMITDLSQSKFLHILSSDRIYSLMDELNLMEKEKYSTEDLKRVASQGGVSHVIRGSFITAGDKFIINASLMNGHTAEVISSIREEGTGEVSITDSLDEISQHIKEDLNLSQEQISTDLDKELGQITTQSPEAYKYYSQGVNLHNKGRYRESIPLYERAIRMDPEFALAYRNLGIVYGNLGLAPQGRECIEKAMELKDRLSDRERLLIEGSYYDDVENTYQKAVAAYESLLEAGGDLIALQTLGAPSTLNASFLSTNLIENPYRNVRKKLGRVTRFRPETDQASRWLATGLLEAEKGFRRIRGHADLRTLHDLLRKEEAAPSDSGSKDCSGGRARTVAAFADGPCAGCDRRRRRRGFRD